MDTANFNTVAAFASLTVVLVNVIIGSVWLGKLQSRAETNANSIASLQTAVFSRISGVETSSNARMADIDSTFNSRLATVDSTFNARMTNANNAFNARLGTVEATIMLNVAAIAKAETMAQTLWAFQMRRGAAEALTTHLATMESPLRFNERAVAALEPLRSRLQAYVSGHLDYNPQEMLLGIEYEFGNELLMDFCLPLGAYQGACLLAALQVGSGKLIELVPNDNVLRLVPEESEQVHL